MKTIVLIENDIVELESLVAIFKKWQKEINVLTAREEEAAINIISSQQVDLVICNLSLPGKNELQDISRLTASFPFVPCIAIASKGKDTPGRAVKMGASRCLERPIDAERLLDQVTELLELSSSGTVKGIPIHSFLQMLESDRKTCTLLIHSKKETGILYIRDGVLIGAETPTLRNEEAALAIMNWDEAVIEIKYLNDQRQKEIDTPLLTLIMDAFQLRNERDRHHEQHISADRPARERDHWPDAEALVDRLPRHLKHIPTAGNPIALDIGLPIRLEIAGIDTDQTSTVVGMLPDRLLIVTTPSPCESVSKAIDRDHRITVRYIHAGKDCMFRTRVLRIIDTPAHLLLLDYPQAIHCHDLRRARRTTIFIPCTLHLKDGAIFYGILIDLSTSGTLFLVRIKAERPAPRAGVGDEIQLHCLLPGCKDEQEAAGVVRNINMTATEIRIGIEFSHLQVDLRETIDRYLFSIEKVSN